MNATFQRIVIPATCFAACLVIPGCYGTEAGRAMWGIVTNLAFFGLLVLASTALCFALNRIVSDKEGRTLQRWCSVAGVVVYPLLFLAFASCKWGFHWPAIAGSVVLGGIVGWFSYTLDELMEAFWEQRRTTLPAVIGLTVGLTFIASMFTRVWLRGDMYVTHRASATRVVIQRYYEGEDKEGKKTYYWGYFDHVDRVALGVQPPSVTEGVDYRLGSGALGKKDRVDRCEHYYWIGGYLYSEADGAWEPFRWLRLARKNLHYDLETIQRVASDYYGHPIANEGKVRPPKLPPPEPLLNPELPNDLPPEDTIAKTFSHAWHAVRMMVVEREYRLLLSIIVAVYGGLGIAAIFLPAVRYPAGIFVACSTVVIFLIMMVLLAASQR